VRIGIAAIAIAIGFTAASGAAGQKGVKTATCRIQSGAGFSHAFTDPRNVAVGPFAFVNLRDAGTQSRESIKQHGGWKSPAVLRIKHRAVVTIDKDARPYARLDYTHFDARFRDLPHTVRYVACKKRSEAISNSDGKPITFWSGFFVVKKVPACVGMKVKVDKRRARHFKIGIGRNACAT
jgi:hypothetical protein